MMRSDCGGMATISAEPQARRAIDNSTTIGMRLACVSTARRVRNDDSATYGDWTLEKRRIHHSFHLFLLLVGIHSLDLSTRSCCWLVM
jgi:hypothetical protein